MSSPHQGTATNTLVSVPGASGAVHFVIVENTDAAATVYLQFHRAASATVGTTAPALSLPCPPGVTGFYMDGCVLGTAGVHYAATTAPGNNTNPASAVRVNLGYS